MNYEKIISFAKEAKVDYAHNFDHVLRVFHSAMKIAEGHPEADTEVLRTAVLLHDIGRSDLTAAHAKKGAVMAKEWLIQNRYGDEFAGKVARVISAHSDKDEARDAGIEGKILWDADKLEMTGVIGALRAMLYCEEAGLPIKAESPSVGEDSISPRDLIEQYAEDMEIASRGFHTKEAMELAKERLAFGYEMLKRLDAEIPKEDLL